MKRALLICLITLASATAAAQQSSVIAANVMVGKNATKVATADICFTATDDQDRQLMGFAVGGGGVQLNRPICGTVTDGAIEANFRVPNPLYTTPQIRYRIEITSPEGRVTYRKVYFSDATFDLDKYAPVANIPGPMGGGNATAFQGRAISPDKPNDGEGYFWNESLARFELKAGSGAPDANASTKGVLVLAGDLGGTADAPTVPGLASKVDTTDARLTDARTPTAHTHGEDEVTNLLADLAAKAAVGHGHAIADVTGLQAALDAKAAQSALDTTNTALALKADDAAVVHASSLDTDATLAANSNAKIPSQAAVKSYVDAHAGGSESTPALSESSDTVTSSKTFAAPSIAIGAGSPTLLGFTTYTVATLPSPPPTGLNLAEVSDGTSPSDCTVGGGSSDHWCRWTGTAWVTMAIVVPQSKSDLQKFLATYDATTGEFTTVQPSCGGLSDAGAACSKSVGTGSTQVAAGDHTHAGMTVTVASGTQALGTGAIASGACATAIAVTATGVASTDTVLADFNADPTGLTGYAAATTGSLTVYKWPSANTVNIRVCNGTSASITPVAATLNYRVVR